MDANFQRSPLLATTIFSTHCELLAGELGFKPLPIRLAQRELKGELFSGALHLYLIRDTAIAEMRWGGRQLLWGLRTGGFMDTGGEMGGQTESKPVILGANQNLPSASWEKQPDTGVDNS